MALGVMSSRLPIGVGTRYNIYWAVSTWVYPSIMGFCSIFWQAFLPVVLELSLDTSMIIWMCLPIPNITLPPQLPMWCMFSHSFALWINNSLWGITSNFCNKSHFLLIGYYEAKVRKVRFCLHYSCRTRAEILEALMAGNIEAIHDKNTTVMATSKNPSIWKQLDRHLS